MRRATNQSEKAAAIRVSPNSGREEAGHGESLLRKSGAPKRGAAKSGAKSPLQKSGEKAVGETKASVAANNQS